MELEVSNQAPEFWSGAVPFSRMIRETNFVDFFFFFLVIGKGRNLEFLDDKRGISYKEIFISPK